MLFVVAEYSILKCALPKLYFTKATQHNNAHGVHPLQYSFSPYTSQEHQEYFHLVLTLFVQCGANNYPAISSISEPLIVRGNHPGKYAERQAKVKLFMSYLFKMQQRPRITNSPTSAEDTPQEEMKMSQPVMSTQLQTPKNSITPSPVTAQNSPLLEIKSTSPGNDSVVLMGKVGINTDTPTEALTVIGNIAVTGSVYQPSGFQVER